MAMLRSLAITVLTIVILAAAIHAQQIAPVKCGTLQAMLVKGGKQPLELPNNFRDSIFSTSGKFVIHFDLASSNPDSVTTPEYADWAARLADSAYDLEVVQLGYAAPPFSSGSHYDIYLTPKPYSSYGATLTVPGGSIDGSPSGLPRSATFVLIDNRFTDPIYATKGYDALRITIFHEFFHVIQFGSYGYRTSNSYFQEMSSVWMEMLSTPGVLDWLTPGGLGAGKYFKTLDLSWEQSPTGGYGQGIYLRYLDTLYSPSVVREIWSDISSTNANPLSAVDAVLEQHGSSFCQAYLGFGVQAFQSGRRFNRANLLPDASRLPTDSLPIMILDSNLHHFDALPTSLTFFTRGFGADTCATILSRMIDRSIASGDIRMPIEGQAILNVSDPSSICDTTFCLAPPIFVSTVSPNPLSPAQPGPIYFVASRGAAKPSSVLLDIYSVTMVPLAHFAPPAEAYGATYRVSWDSRDENGRDLPSGEYIYSLAVDGKKSAGKLVIVR
jgi:hypothetical protein